jgi:hypothetical protein
MRLAGRPSSDALLLYGYVSYKRQTDQVWRFVLSYLLTVPSGWNWRERRESLRARLQNSMDTLTSMRNCKTLEVRFRALLTEDEIRQLEVMRA